MKELKNFLIMEGFDEANFPFHLNNVFTQFQWDEVNKIRDLFKKTKSLYKTLEKLGPAAGWAEFIDALGVSCDATDEYHYEEEDLKNYIKKHDEDISKMILISLGEIKIEGADKKS